MSAFRRLFVLLRHESSGAAHWDLMLDVGATLETWQLLDDPTTPGGGDPPRTIRARRLADHRRAYLDYQGPVSGGRGSVSRLDRGEYEVIEQQPDGWTVRLAGSSLRGTYRLTADQAAEQVWTFQRVAD